MIFLTGDTHGEIDIHKLGASQFPQDRLTKQDYVVILGDFGLVWDGSPNELYWRKWLEKKPWTTLVVLGNHENYDMIEQLPISEMFGGRVRILSPSIIILMTGEVYEIDYHKIFVFGGAYSIDQSHRLPGRSWWPQEIPSQREFNNAIENLEKHNWEVDYVLTHTCPKSELENFSDGIGTARYPTDPTTLMLDEIKEKIKFKHWAFGHFHQDMSDGKFTTLFRQVVLLGNNVK